MSSLEDCASPPPQLPAMLTLLKQKFHMNAEKTKQLEKDFDEHARISAAAYAQSSLDVKMFYTTNIANKSNDNNSNASLMIIFGFYCRMDQTYSSSFSMISLANETMSKKEFLLFCKDFNLYKLITREDAKGLWKNVKSMETKRSYGKKVETIDLDFDTFCELLVLCALLAYNKKGLKNMIHALHGPNLSAISPKHAIEYFCHFLRLDDELYVSNFIQTVGRKTQGQLNFVAMNEKSSIVLDEIYEEQKEKLRKAEIIHENKKKLSKLSGFDTRSVGSQSLNTLETKSSRNNINSSDESKTSLKSSSIRRKFPSPDKSRLPSTLIPKLYSDDDHGNDNCSFNFDNDTQGGNTSMYSNDDSTPQSELEEILNDNYKPGFINLLDKYRFDAIGGSNSSCVTVDGTCINIGYIKPGLTLILQLKILNKSSHQVALDITVSGLENSKVITHPNPLISGFSRNVTVMFSTCSLDSIGFINISYVDEKRGTHIIAMPIHFSTISTW